jgi:hypothetical protein
VREVLWNWRVGARINNATFLSTTTLRGSYNLAQGMSRIIKVRSTRGAASIMNLSTTKKENEVLFRPNTAMKITKITQLPNRTPKKDGQKDDPGAKYNTDLSRAGALANPYEIDERKDSGVRDVHDFSKSYTTKTLPPEHVRGRGDRRRRAERGRDRQEQVRPGIVQRALGR